MSLVLCLFTSLTVVTASILSLLAAKKAIALIQSRTVDLDLTKVTLYQLSYKGPIFWMGEASFQEVDNRQLMTLGKRENRLSAVNPSKAAQTLSEQSPATET